MHILLTGQVPFKGKDEKNLFKKIGDGKLHLKPHLSADASSLLHSLLEVDPSRRFTAEQALQHSWLASLAANV